MSNASQAPRVSIVIVVWNALEFLRPCLRSIFAPGSDRSNTELFVVDNGSTDGTADRVAAEFPQVRLIRRAENLVSPAANNIALRVILAERSADVVILLNSDVVWISFFHDMLNSRFGPYPGCARSPGQ
ncbi:MAG: glycosyltransferase [Candidatus Aminicenantes bacterium]|nr:glycosyltransferase [Candidatus Aminicenantes bacterium]